jgi:hypothetical protein
VSSLFDLTGEALHLQRQIDAAAQHLFSADPAEVAEATATLEALIGAESQTRQDLEARADAWCWVIDELRARAEAQKSHAKRLASLAQEASQRADALQDRLVAALLRVYPGETLIDLPEHRLTSRKSTAVEMDPELDPEDLPEDLQRTKVELDKAAAKEKIQTAIAAAVAGLEGDEAAKAAAVAAVSAVPGVSLVERRSWTIR